LSAVVITLHALYQALDAARRQAAVDCALHIGMVGATLFAGFDQVCFGSLRIVQKQLVETTGWTQNRKQKFASIEHRIQTIRARVILLNGHTDPRLVDWAYMTFCDDMKTRIDTATKNNRTPRIEPLTTFDGVVIDADYIANPDAAPMQPTTGGYAAALPEPDTSFDVDQLNAELAEAELADTTVDVPEPKAKKRAKRSK